MLVTNIMAMGRWDQTHEALRHAALDLFMKQGYDATGTAQIARQVGVSEVTLFRHFAAKESLLLDDPFDPLMAEAVRARPAHEPPMRALAEGIRQAWGQVDVEVGGEQRDRLRILAANPSLRGAIERSSQATVSALADALTDRAVPEVRARVAAASVIAGLSAALLEWARTERTPVDEVLQAALDVLGGE